MTDCLNHYEFIGFSDPSKVLNCNTGSQSSGFDGVLCDTTACEKVKLIYVSRYHDQCVNGSSVKMDASKSKCHPRLIGRESSSEWHPLASEAKPIQEKKQQGLDLVQMYKSRKRKVNKLESSSSSFSCRIEKLEVEVASLKIELAKIRQHREMSLDSIKQMSKETQKLKEEVKIRKQMESAYKSIILDLETR